MVVNMRQLKLRGTRTYYFVESSAYVIVNTILGACPDFGGETNKTKKCLVMVVLCYLLPKIHQYAKFEPSNLEDYNYLIMVLDNYIPVSPLKYEMYRNKNTEQAATEPYVYEALHPAMEFIWRFREKTSLDDLKNVISMTCVSPATPDALRILINAVTRRYTVSDPNLIWCVDSTERGGIHVILIVDLASRLILAGYCVQKAPTTSDIILSLDSAIEKAGGKPRYLHADQGSCFMSRTLQEYLIELGIVLSTDLRHKYGFDNQVVESFNNVLWSYLGLNRNQPQRIAEFARKSVRNRTILVEAVIDYYTNTKELTGKNYSARDLYEALVAINLKLNVQVSSSDPVAKDVEVIHDHVVDLVVAKKRAAELAARSEDQFLAIYKIMDGYVARGVSGIDDAVADAHRLRPLIQAIGAAFAELQNNFVTIMESQSKMLNEQRETKETLLDEMRAKDAVVGSLTQQVQELVQQLTTEREERAQKIADLAARREARLHAQKLPLRSQVDDGDLQSILEAVKGEQPYYVARDRIAIILIFMFGIRISNVSLITVQNLRRLTEGKPIEIKLLKDRGGDGFRLVPSAKMQEWFKAYRKDLDCFLLDKRLAPTDSIYGTSRETLNRRINKILKMVGDAKGKFLRSHSARITVATRTIEKFGITKAKKVLGHKSIMSTIHYDRNQMTAEEQGNVYDAVTPSAPVVIIPKGRPRKDASTVGISPFAKPVVAREMTLKKGNIKFNELPPVSNDTAETEGENPAIVMTQSPPETSSGAPTLSLVATTPPVLENAYLVKENVAKIDSIPQSVSEAHVEAPLSIAVPTVPPVEDSTSLVKENVAKMDSTALELPAKNPDAGAQIAPAPVPVLTAPVVANLASALEKSPGNLPTAVADPVPRTEVSPAPVALGEKAAPPIRRRLVRKAPVEAVKAAPVQSAASDLPKSEDVYVSRIPYYVPLGEIVLAHPSVLAGASALELIKACRESPAKLTQVLADVKEAAATGKLPTHMLHLAKAVPLPPQSMKKRKASLTKMVYQPAVEAEAKPGVEPASVTPKKRGRPSGSKNKQAVVENNSTE